MAAEGEKKPNVAGLLGLLLTIIVLTWQTLVVKEYSAEWPSSLWSGETATALNPSCSDIFFVMHWTVFFTFFILCVEAFAHIPVLNCIFAPCILCCRCAECVAQVSKFGLALWGIVITAFTAKAAETDAMCPDLYTCAWWTFLAPIVFAVVLCCCQVCCGSPSEPGETTPLKEGASA